MLNQILEENELIGRGLYHERNKKVNFFFFKYTTWILII